MANTVTEVPGLPAGFTDTFGSRTVRVDGNALHAVVGGSGPALLLLPGWPQFWYSWRLVMPALAERFTVVAADLRGMGGSDKPESGYDASSLARDVTGLMGALGHDRFAVAGFDLGMMVGHVLAAREPERVTRLAVIEAILPGISPMPSLDDAMINEFLWHFSFNRLAQINDRMVAGREEIYFGHQFASKAASPTAIPPQAVDVYVAALRDPAARRAGFEYYRRLDESAAQIVALAGQGRLAMPVLAVGAERSLGAGVGATMREVAADVTEVVVPGVGHFVPEEAPDVLLEELIRFLGADPGR